MTFINALENLITVGTLSRQWDSTVFNDTEEVGTEVTKLSQNNVYFFTMCICDQVAQAMLTSSS